MPAFFTKANITLFLSIIGTVGTLYTLISTMVFQRKNLHIKVHAFSVIRDMGIMYVTVENRSRLPIAITSLEIEVSNTFISCCHEPKRIAERVRKIGGEVVSRSEYYSMTFPISLSSLAATSGYLCFGNIPDNVSAHPTEVTFQVQTNRGTLMKRKLSISQEPMSFLPNP